MRTHVKRFAFPEQRSVADAVCKMLRAQYDADFYVQMVTEDSMVQYDIWVIRRDGQARRPVVVDLERYRAFASGVHLTLANLVQFCQEHNSKKG